jgi:transcriptional regulator with XRE-family HTH domain
MPGLSKLLVDEMDARGWSQADLAARAGMGETTLSKIIRRPDMVPELPNLARLSSALDIPLGRLIAACGFDVGQAASDAAGSRVAAIVSASPQLQQFFLQLLETVLPEDQDAILTYLEALRLRRGRK